MKSDSRIENEKTIKNLFITFHLDSENEKNVLV